MASTGQQLGVAVGLALLVAMTNGRTADLAGPTLIEAAVQSTRTAILTATAGIVVAAVVAVIPIYLRHRTVLVSAIPETVAR